MISSISDGFITGVLVNPQVTPAVKGELHDRPPPLKPDKVDISDKGKELFQLRKEKVGKIKSEAELTAEEKRELESLKAADREVRAHERAHMSAGAGIVVSGASYDYDVGPDGKFYAVAGEVKIDVSGGKDPEDTIQKMQKVKRAALAPAQPSSTDRAVAAEASSIEAQARIELSQESFEGLNKPRLSASENPKDAAGFISTYTHTNQFAGENLNIVV